MKTGGPIVALSASNSPQATFTAPAVGTGGAALTFVLTVSDGIDSATDTVAILVQNVNRAPTANVGPDQTKTEGSAVTLDGRASQDPDGDPLRYLWTQLSGPPVTLSGGGTATPSFVATPVGPNGATLVFQLRVDDGLGGSGVDQVKVLVRNGNDPPVCTAATPSPASLWPPNHGLIPVSIVGITDPNHDTVTVTAIGVTQDEPVNGLGDGNTSPDAVRLGHTLLLRAERTGTGNGRVYRVRFRATDREGGSCIGVVTVCVPHDQGQGRICIDDGQPSDPSQR